MTETRDMHGFVLCCHGRPIMCAECGEEYAAELNAPRPAAPALPPQPLDRLLIEKLEKFHATWCDSNFASVCGDSQRCSCGLSSLVDDFRLQLAEKNKQIAGMLANYEANRGLSR